MAGVEVPDQVPEAFRERYGIARLRDEERPPDPSRLRFARRYAEASVAQVKRLLFPLHGLPATG
jgi:hypothetical protein